MDYYFLSTITGFQVFLCIVYGLSLITTGYRTPKILFINLFLVVSSVLIASVLFSGGGTIHDPKGDGIITHLLRGTEKESPLVLLSLPFALIFSYVIPIWIMRKSRRQYKDSQNNHQESLTQTG
jgi:hypothetical protein